MQEDNTLDPATTDRELLKATRRISRI